MKRQLLLISIIPLMMTLSSCKNETPSDNTGAIDKEALKEEVKLLDNIEVISPVEDPSLAKDLIYDKFLDECSLTMSYVRGKSYDSEVGQNTDFEGYITSNAYSNYYVHTEVNVTEKYKSDIANVSKDVIYNYHTFALPDHKMVVEYNDFGDGYVRASRYFYEDVIKKITYTETEDSFYHGYVYQSGFYYAHSFASEPSTFSSMNMYKINDGYILIHEFQYNSTWAPDLYKLTYQDIIYVDNDLHLLERTSYYNVDFYEYDKVKEDHVFAYNYEHQFLRQRYSYAPRVEKDISSIKKVVEDEFATGYVVDMTYSVTTAGSFSWEYYSEYYHSGKTPNKTCEGEVRIYIINGTVDSTYAFTVTLNVRLTSSLYDKGLSFIIFPDYYYTSESIKHTVYNNGVLRHTYYKDDDNDTYNRITLTATYQYKSDGNSQISNAKIDCEAVY